jgi:hypothetical protein
MFLSPFINSSGKRNIKTNIFVGHIPVNYLYSELEEYCLLEYNTL